MTLSTARLLVFAFTTITRAAPTRPAESDQSTIKPDTRWSKEAIFTFIGVLVAVIGILVTFTASKKLRRGWYRRIRRNHQHSMQQLRHQYDEYRAFREWLEMTTS
ncbi:hypothetical protein CC86DRAFT_369135 [Ophiobolus disseminans]|uniref:Uncharacterized protein n=1 Tax=Ophiobolus disseminans TaxID=1469910 RepID=A0A6A7A5D3_9PLEO|nr:hypothetical protein CC86DRAFT_369135 [Ophiobolus disseminans]